MLGILSTYIGAYLMLNILIVYSAETFNAEHFICVYEKFNAGYLSLSTRKHLILDILPMSAWKYFIRAFYQFNQDTSNPGHFICVAWNTFNAKNRFCVYWDLFCVYLACICVYAGYM